MALGTVSSTLGWNPNASAFTGPPITPRVLPRGIMSGLTARSYSQGTGSARALIDSMVLGFYVADAMPTRGTLDATWKAGYRAQLDWALANTGTSGRSIPVCARPLFGIHSPSYFHTLAGHMEWYTTHGTDADPTQPDPLSPTFFKIPSGNPIWWDHASATVQYKTLCEEFYVAFAAEFATHAAIVEIDVGDPQTQFKEPCNHQGGSQTNVNTLIANGWTDALDTASYTNAWDTYRRIWAPYRVAGFTTYNPPGSIDIPTAKFRNGNSPRAITLMETQMAMMGGLTVLANESLVNTKVTGGDYGILYGRQIAAKAATPPTIIRYQSETLGNISGQYATGASVQATVESAISMGGTTLEIPVGCELPNSTQPLQYISPAAAAVYNTRFTANTTGLWV